MVTGVKGVSMELPKRAPLVPHGFKKTTREYFDKCYEHMLETERLDRVPEWDERNCSITWNDVRGNPVFLLLENFGVERYIKNGYLKHVFSKEL